MTTNPESLPIVSIVGRVNVGKSTLFNRIASGAKAIVHDRPGVTRDIQQKIVESPYGSFMLQDTAGFINAKGHHLDAKINQYNLNNLEKTHVILLVFDAISGPTSLDFTFANNLKKLNSRVILLANKSEGAIDLNSTYESLKFGFGEPIPCSAAHAQGIEQILIAIAQKISENQKINSHIENSEQNQQLKDEQEYSQAISIAIIGRPNVGKSSLKNRLLKEYRMITGTQAGITRDPISTPWIWNNHKFILTDTAGVRKKAKVQDQVEKLAVSGSINSIKNAHVVALMLEPNGVLEKQDLTLVSHAFKEGTPTILVINKWDTIKKSQASKINKTIKDRIKKANPILGGADFITLSTKTGYGINNLPKQALNLYRKASSQISTPELNLWLRKTVEKHKPPAVNNKPIKLRYITQNGTHPISCIIFGHRTNHITPSYIRYLTNSFSEHFKLRGLPIKFFFRQSSTKSKG